MLLVVGVVATGCTVGTPDPDGPPIAQFEGANDLLYDPALLTPRVDLDLTLDLVGAAQHVGVELSPGPNESMVQAMIANSEGDAARLDRQVRWAALEHDRSGVGDAAAQIAAACPVDGTSAEGPAGEICVGLLRSGFRSVRADAPELEEVWTEATGYALAQFCADEPDEDPGQSPYDQSLCGNPPSIEALRTVVAELDQGKQAIGSSALVWQLSAAAARAGEPERSQVRALVDGAVDGDTVNGMFVDNATRIGTVLTTWALLHLARGDVQGLDKEALVTALRRASSSAPDRSLLSQAALSLLGDTSTSPGERRVVLSDPDGPYNPFLALAAKDAGRYPNGVSLGYSIRRARTSVERLAVYALTYRLASGRQARVTPQDTARLAAAYRAAEDSPRLRLLLATALASMGVTADPRVSLPRTDCAGASWLVSYDDGPCDLRASLLTSIYRELVAADR